MSQLSFFDAPPVEAAASHNGGSRPGVALKPDLDYRITIADAIGADGQMTKVRQNIEIIRLLKRLKEENRQATPAEQKQLVRWTGWGHSGNLFHPKPSSKWIDFQTQLKPLLNEEEWRAASFSTINAHYTSPEVIHWQWAVVEQLGFSGGRILEPAAGAGHYFGLMPEAIKAKSQLWAVELDLLSAAVVKQLYPSVKLHVGGYETTTYEPEFFDLAISNVPFANLKVHDSGIYENGRSHLADIGLHNYFFVKALEHVRPGGLISFITSRFTMDSLESKVRAYLAEHAWFLGAVRLPVTAFKKNAHTEVTTDIVFLMKRGDRENEIPAYDFVNTVSKGEYRLNEFYDFEHYGLLGEMQKEGGRYEDAFECVAPKDFDLVGELDKRLRLFSEGLYRPAAPRPRRQIIIEPHRFENPPADPWIRRGSYAMDDWYRIWHYTGHAGNGWKRADLDGRQLSRVRGLIEVRDAFHRCIQANVNFVSDEHLKKAQQELNAAYRRFVAKWGYLHEPANIAAFGDDVDSDNILALERWDPFEGKAEKAAIFSERLLEPETRPDKADSPIDALIIALRETGQVALPRMMELTGQSEAELTEALAGKIYFDPAIQLWVTADEYLSGNVRQKLNQLEHMQRIERENDLSGVAPFPYEANILALREVMPRPAGPKDIFVQLGAPWVPREIVEEFIMRRLFDNPYEGRIRPQYLQTLGYWRLDLSEARGIRHSQENRQMWGTTRIEGVDLIEKCLNQQQATIYDEWEDDDGKKHKTVNQEDTLVARAKQEEIRQAFDKWIWANEARTDRLVLIYNQKFNSTLPRKFDGTPLHFPGMNPKIILRQIQKDVVWRGLQQQALMIAHSVGFGKTYSLTGLTMRLRQTWLRKRVMIVVKRATFGQFVASFREAYPLATVSPIASGQSQHHRRRQLARIVTEDYDAIITTHPVFYQIPLKPATKQKFLRDQIRELEEAIFEARGDRISTKELEKARKRLELKLRKAMEQGAAHDENALYFEDLGLDALLVDESGAYKNLWFHSIMTRISGVGGSESGRAFDMFLKIRHLQGKGGFIAFSTGTPVENSISEVWVMMNYLMPDRLRELGLHHFDAWAATFGKVVTGVEMKPDGSGFRMASRFASFNNLVQLKRLWWEVADTQMDADKAGIVRPPLMTDKPIGIDAKPYPELKRIIETLANRANNLGQKDPHIDNILKIMSDADKASLDARLLGEFPVVDEYGKPTGEVIHITGDYAGSKVNLCADQVAQIYHDTHAAELPGLPGWHPLTQLIFLDSSTPKGNEWSVYADLRQKLMDRGVKAEHIAFAQGYSDDDKKARLAAALNAGKIRIAIGHTEIMGIGLNCQRLLVALHHLDCPWKPAWLEQRDGRIWRQGNLCPTISIYRYVMGGSFDVYRWQTVERKYNFIVQFNSDDLTVNTIEDPGMAVLSAREMTALATGNPAIMRQVELQTRLRILNAQKREHDDLLYKTRSRRNRLQRELENDRRKLDRYQTLLQPAQEQGLDPAITLGQQLYDLAAPHFETLDRRVEIGQLYNLKVFYLGTQEEEKPERVHAKVDRNYWGAADAAPLEGEEAKAPEGPPPPPKIKVDKEIYLVNDDLDFEVKFDLRIVEETRATLNANVLKRLYEEELPEKVRERQADVADGERQLAETERILSTPFEKADELAAIEAELQGVEREIRDTLGEADAAENRQAARVELQIGQEAEEIIPPDDADDASEYPQGYDEGEME